MSDKESIILNEARRQLANVQHMLDMQASERELYLAALRAQCAYDGMLHILRSTSNSLLVLGQAQYVLDGNADQATATFGELAVWMPFFDEAYRGSGEPFKQSLHLLIEPIVCLLLAADWTSLDKIRNAEIPEIAHIRSTDVRNLFFRALRRILRSAGHEKVELGPMDIPPKFIFSGYDKLLIAIAGLDRAAFESQRARLGSAYPERGKRRETALTWDGSGKASQAATFDALGTALCCLAVRCGLQVDVDTRLYPQVFISRAHVPSGRQT
jgi:hypothetical protein